MREGRQGRRRGRDFRQTDRLLEDDTMSSHTITVSSCYLFLLFLSLLDIYLPLRPLALCFSSSSHPDLLFLVFVPFSPSFTLYVFLLLNIYPVHTLSPLFPLYTPSLTTHKQRRDATRREYRHTAKSSEERDCIVSRNPTHTSTLSLYQQQSQ